MPFVEVFSTPGTPRPEQRIQISKRLVAEVMAGEGVPDNEFARSISWLVWHDIEVMSVGGELTNGGPPRYVVRITMPEPSLTDDKRDAIIKRVTQVLADADDDPDRLYTTPALFVLFNEVPDGDWGGIGRVVRFNEIANYALTGQLTAMDDDELRRFVNATPAMEEARR